MVAPVRPTPASGAGAPPVAGTGGCGFDINGYIGEKWIREGRVVVAARGKQRVAISKVDGTTAYKHSIGVFAVRPSLLLCIRACAVRHESHS